MVEGEIISLPQNFGRGVRFEFEVNEVITPSHITLPSKIRISWYEPVSLHNGERWCLTVRLKRPHGSLNPGGMDYEQWLFTHHIGATGYVRHKSENGLLEPANQRSIQFFRQTLDQRLSTALSES